MLSPVLRPADFNPREGLIQDRLPIIRKEMIGGRAENPNNILILIGPTEEKFVVNKCLAKIFSRRLEKAMEKASELNESPKFPEIVPKSFQTMLECVILEMNWKFTNLKETCDLIETASQFGFYSYVQEIREAVFQEAQTRENVFDDEKSVEIFLFQCFGYECLRKKALKHILKNGTAFFRGNQFLNLSLEDFGEILIQDKLQIESEIDVLNAAIRWGLNVLKNENKLGSPENLRNALAEPLNWIRFPNVEEREFRDYVIPMKILNDQQIKSMELWYKSGGPISLFSNQPRNYLKAKNASPAGNDSKSMEEFIHTTKMDNLIAKFNMNIELLNVQTGAGSKILELESNVRRLESTFEQLEKFFEANRFCQKLEALKKYYESSSAQAAGNPTNEIDYNLLKVVADKIRKNEDFSGLLMKIEEPVGIDLQLLESGNDTVATKILELRKVRSSETYESLSWKIFQQESNSVVQELQKFPNTKTFACAIIFKNNTADTIQNFQSYIFSFDVYMALPSHIQPFCTHNYGQTYDDDSAGLLSYDIGSIRIVIRHDFQQNDFGIAFATLTFPVNNDGFDDFLKQDWTNDSTKIKALCQAPTEIEKCIKLGNLYLHAEIIGTAPKAVLRVLLTSV